jgi:hypothetical protein
MATTSKPRQQTARTLATQVRQELRGADGLRVVGSGELARANTHPKRTLWVEIEADSVLDCDVAEYRLGDLDQFSPPAWADGWSLAENRQLELSFRLRLFAPTP